MAGFPIEQHKLYALYANSCHTVTTNRITSMRDAALLESRQEKFCESFYESSLPQCRTNIRKGSLLVSKVLNFLILLVLKFEMQQVPLRFAVS